VDSSTSPLLRLGLGFKLRSRLTQTAGFQWLVTQEISNLPVPYQKAMNQKMGKGVKVYRLHDST
jgi:hypothetical protein